jgi:DNA-binding MarR family transcriptional regulator
MRYDRRVIRIPKETGKVSESLSIPDDSGFDGDIEKIRGFNRMYLHRIGVLDEKIFDSPFSLAEVRILNELSFRGETTASALARDLKMDSGYISRIMRRFERAGLIARAASASDRRQRLIALTEKGRQTGDHVLAAARRNVQVMLRHVAPQDIRRLVSAMETIDGILNHGK